MLYTFTDCELDTQRRTFRRAGQFRHLRPKVFDVLLYLLMHCDRVIAKQELCEQVWPEQFISDTTIESTMRAVRQAVGDSGKGQQLIQTFVRHGYRWVAAVAERGEEHTEGGTRGDLEQPQGEAGHTGSEDATPGLLPALEEQGGSLPADPLAGQEERCPACQTVHGQHGGVCEAGGMPHGQVCSDCGQVNEPHARFCVACRTDLDRQGPALHHNAAETPHATSGTATIRPATTTASGGGTDAERRHLTVLYCSLEAALERTTCLDSDTLHEVMQTYHTACAAIVARFEGYIAQYLSAGLLVYFGFPLAHEDDAQRAVRAGLEIVEAVPHVVDQPMSLEVRVGIHTGPVIVGSVGAGGQQTPLALGEVPQGAARLLAQAAPQTVVCSAATWRLVAGWFLGEALQDHALSDLARPEPAYRVLGESGVQSRLEITGPERLTPLVGRVADLVLLQERWAQARDGMGQVVLLSGEAGIGKSRLAETLRTQVAAAGCPQIVWRCSPYHTHSALAPVIEHLRRVARFHSEDTPATKLHKLEQMLEGYRLVPAQVVPLFAALLAVPLGQRYPSLPLASEQHRQQTHAALVAWLLEEAERQPIFVLCEDLHWADPSTLDLLSLLITQVPTVPMFTLLVCRPEFRPPWTLPAHLTHLTLSRFTRPQAEQMLAALVGSDHLPEEVREQVLARTDGVPLFLEEFVKMLRETGLLLQTDHNGRTTPRLSLTIPTTLQDALMARLDRLGSARELAQLGATWGREFTYTQMQSLVPLEEVTLQQRLAQLVEAEILYQRGLPPLASYRFKHALIQETAYQTLVRSARQTYHRRIAQVVAERFPDIVETQPELLAHHYTEAGFIEQAIPFWHQAGERATGHSAHVEAVSHFSKGVALLKTLPETPEHRQQELDLQLALGPALSAIKGYATPEVKQVYARAHVLCAEVGDTAQLFPTLWGLLRFYMGQGTFATAREIAEHLVYLAERTTDPTNHLRAYDALVAVLGFMGECAAALPYMERGIALIDPASERALALRQGLAPGVRCQAAAANIMGFLGFPTLAVQRAQEALALAREVGHPYSLAAAYTWLTYVYRRRREVPEVLALAESLVTLASTQGFPLFLGLGTCWRGWAHALLGEGAVGLAELRQGMTIVLAAGQMTARPLGLVLLAEATGYLGQVEDGLALLGEALAALEANERGDLLADAYRLQGTFLLQQEVPDAVRAEACLQQALSVARRQQARALELQAASSLSHLWQSQGKRVVAQQLLAEVYDWFTEGFETTDLQEAKALLKDMA